MHKYPKIVIVDETDTVIGVETYEVAIKKGLIRRASRVFVFDEQGNFLVQKRSAKVNKPLLFDQSVGGHVDEGEEYLEAAVREMQEELGLEGYALQEIATSYRGTTFFNAIYKTVIPADTVIAFDTEEVASVHWMTPDKVDVLVTNRADECTDDFVQVWKEFRNKLVQ